jgi:hypothetical protein
LEVLGEGIIAVIICSDQFIRDPSLFSPQNLETHSVWGEYDALKDEIIPDSRRKIGFIPKQLHTSDFFITYKHF